MRLSRNQVWVMKAVGYLIGGLTVWGIVVAVLSALILRAFKGGCP
jgi:hypothetical protein